MGHGSIEPDNSGGTVDIERFFLRYEGREPPLPIQSGRQHCYGGVKKLELLIDIVTDKRNPAAARTTTGDCSFQERGTGWNLCAQSSISSYTQTARLRYFRRSGACPALPRRSKC